MLDTRQVCTSWTLKSSVLGKVVSYGGQCWRLTFFVGGNYLVFKVVAKLTYLLAIIGGHVAVRLQPIVSLLTKQNSIWSRALIMPSTIWNYVSSPTNRRIISVKIGLFF